MRILKRDRAILHCRKCGTDKSAHDFYVSNLSICMNCKRAKVKAYKKRTNYNFRYKLSMEVAA